MSHTPGPWRALGSAVTYWGAQTSNNRDDKTHQLAEIYSGKKQDTILIAAAPEMFEVLQDLSDIFPSALHNGHHDLIQRVKDVLKKARGE